eukprot:7386578-Prymnesium_polylepis.2
MAAARRFERTSSGPDANTLIFASSSAVFEYGPVGWKKCGSDRWILPLHCSQLWWAPSPPPPWTGPTNPPKQPGADLCAAQRGGFGRTGGYIRGSLRGIVAAPEAAVRGVEVMGKAAYHMKRPKAIMSSCGKLCNRSSNRG